MSGARWTRRDVLEAAKRGCPPAAIAAERLSTTPLDRRTFLQVSMAATGGLLVLFGEPRSAIASQGAPTAGDPSGAFRPNGYVRVDPDDTVTLWASDPDMGEGTKTSLTMLVAEELDADWTRARFENAPLDRARYGGQGVGGSSAIPSAWEGHRRAGATARHLLVAAAAARWNVPAGSCATQRGVVEHAASGRRARYGELAADAARLATPAPEAVRLKAPASFTLIGTRVPGVDTPAIVRGTPLFGIDVRLPGMKYAAIAKAPVFGGRPLSVDDSRARQVPGVRNVVRIEGLENPTFLMPGVAVVADTSWAAFQGRDALVVRWDEGRFGSESSASLEAQRRDLLAREGTLVYGVGDVDGALAQAATVVDATYDCAFVAHATLEPHNCTAEVRDGECWITGPLQMPGSGRAVVAQALGIAPEKVHVQSTRIGGGFGRRLLSDYAAEAAVVARAAGVPVQVIGTREDDLQHDYYRPAATTRVRLGADAQGRVVAWDHHLVSVSRNAYRRDARPPHSTETYGIYVGPIRTREPLDLDLVPTRIPHTRLRYAVPDTGVPTGAWRAPAHMANAFAAETALDELAARVRRSPVDLRLEFLGEPGDIPPGPAENDGYLYDPSRMARVLREAAERGGLGQRPPEGRARGLAAHFTFGSYCAQVVELSVESGQRVRIHRIVVVADVGQPVNLSTLEAQAQGGVLDALGTAFFAEVPIANGRATSRNFGDYRLLRHREAPPVEVVFLPGTARPTGFGEIPLPPVAPAVANAIAALTGDRLRVMPFRRAGYTLA